MDTSFAKDERRRCGSPGELEPWIGHGRRTWSPDEAVASNPTSSKTSDIEISERTAWKSTPGNSALLIAGSRTPLARNQAGKEKRNPYSCVFQLQRARAPLVGQSTTSCRRFNPRGIQPTDSAEEREIRQPGETLIRDKREVSEFFPESTQQLAKGAENNFDGKREQVPEPFRQAP
jgi:hypothetical protein